MGETVLTTTTTKLFNPSREQSAHVIIEADLAELTRKVEKLRKKCMHITAGHGYLDSQEKLAGFEPGIINQIWHTGLFQWILVEADGAARKPLKAPASHEPVIPSSSACVGVIIGLDALGKPLDDRWVFRSGLYSQITGLPLGAPVTAESIASIILDEQGLMKGSPIRAKRFVFLNKADEERLVRAGQKIGSLLLKNGGGALEKVFIGVLEPEPSFAAWGEE
ncbi:MAG: putative selenium-dependent hydroxylase accessory protein YqeC [Deltaproteobacteria bacterium]|nr:putative selenium-dependent hydroxylase accessory protein YqeC [Deltaproteobacteria bacterium]